MASRAPVYYDGAVRGLSLIVFLGSSALAAPTSPSWPPASPHLPAFQKAPPEECLPDPSDAPTPGPGAPGFSINTLEPAAPGALPLPADDLARASAALGARRTRAYWLAKPPAQEVKVGPRLVTAARLALGFETLAGLLESTPDAALLKQALEARFDVYEAAASDGSRQGTITAYYDPEIPLSKTPAPGHVPVLARPDDLGASEPATPYWTRRQIAEGALSGKGLELYWTPHAADLNVLQTQGSGWGRLPDGARTRLAFDGANGHGFHSVGKALRRCRLIPQDLPAPDMLDWLRAQTPEREQKLVNLNPRYVFLKEKAGDGGPWGASGIELVAGRSIAVDPAGVPLGLPGILVSRKPVADEAGKPLGFEDFTRFVFTHDVGSAIRGPVRVDLFWGAGRKAEAEAFRMLFPGRLYVLVLKS